MVAIRTYCVCVCALLKQSGKFVVCDFWPNSYHTQMHTHNTEKTRRERILFVPMMFLSVDILQRPLHQNADVAFQKVERKM